MIAVADTSPICYLVLIGEIELLPALFTEVVIPEGVAVELSHPRAPAPLKDWWQEPPAWIRVAGPGDEPAPDAIERLHRGEREAILLARRMGAGMVLLDDKAARRAAKTLGFRSWVCSGSSQSPRHRVRLTWSRPSRDSGARTSACRQSS